MSFIVFACIIGRFFMTVEIHLNDCNALLLLFQMCARKYSEVDCNKALHINALFSHFSNPTIPLTHLNLMNFPISIGRTSQFQNVRVVGLYVSFLFKVRTFCEQTDETLIRRHSAASDWGTALFAIVQQKGR